MSNAGFVGLMNPLGVLLVLFAAFLFSMIIYIGARLVRVKEASDKLYRARLREQVEARKSNP
jgi:hypothetical protein